LSRTLHAQSQVSRGATSRGDRLEGIADSRRSLLALLERVTVSRCGSKDCFCVLAGFAVTRPFKDPERRCDDE